MGLQSFGRAEAWLESPQSGEMGSLKRHHSERMVWVPSGFLACDGALPRKRTDPGAVCGRARRAAGCERIIRSCHGCSLSWLQGRASVGPSAVRPLASARGKRGTARGRVAPPRSDRYLRRPLGEEKAAAGKQLVTSAVGQPAEIASFSTCSTSDNAGSGRSCKRWPDSRSAGIGRGAPRVQPYGSARWPSAL